MLYLNAKMSENLNTMIVKRFLQKDSFTMLKKAFSTIFIGQNSHNLWCVF